MLKKKRRIGIAIDMTPMVDVAFLLLIFFMCTTQFDPPEEDKISLPESNSEAKSPESGIITIAVTKPTAKYGNQSRVRVTYRRGGNEVKYDVLPTSVKDQMPGILSAARAANPSARLIVKMDKDAPYGVMADLMPALQAAKASRFNVQTDLEAKGGVFAKTGAH
jgi:biopolymer transport protein ExbD